MSRNFKRFVLGLSAALVVFVFLGGSASLHGVRADTQGASDGAYPEIGVYEDVLQKIQSDYVVDPNIDAVTNGALHGLLESLDPASSYLSPAEYKSYKDMLNDGKNGATAQIGLVISKRFGYATVVTVVPGSPADIAKIEDGDILESIEGVSTREMSLALIRLLLEGKPGSELTFSLVKPRKSEPDKVTLTRAIIAEPGLAEQQYDNSSILYLKPGVLTRERVDELESKLRASQKNGGRKILLDLRDVADGDELQGVRLANAFLQSGTIATLEGQKFAKETFTADGSKFITGAPLIVLVNHGTAGAAEIVAAAVLDNKRGQLVGDRTFGEGTVQKTFELPDGAALILSVAKYASPSGKKIQDESVTPNVLVASSDEDNEGPDEDSEPGPTITGTPSKQGAPAGARPAPATPGATKPAPGSVTSAEPSATAPKTDDQLNKALELLRQAETKAQDSSSASTQGSGQ
jgi:carboxyl-terminal processing protease